MTIREMLVEIDEDIIIAEGFDEALLGYAEVWVTAPTGGASRLPTAVYSRRICLDILMARDGMTEEEAAEFFDVNVSGAYIGPRTPIFVFDIGEEE